jgi:hypothetical protein
MGPDSRDLAFANLVHRLVTAALDNDWGEMQRAQRAMLQDAPVSECKEILERVLPDDAQYQRHCKHCGDLRTTHTVNDDMKCLFDSTKYEPCPVRLPENAVAFARAGKPIDAIKAVRVAFGVGLREAKDLVVEESIRHGWSTPWKSPP